MSMETTITPSAVKSYVRIGPAYYKRKPVTTRSGHADCELVPWQRDAIIDDHGMAFLGKIIKCEGFCNVPLNGKAFKAIVNKEYNLYRPTPEHSGNATAWTSIEGFLRHVFGAKYSMGLDYIQLLWTDPMQPLPLLNLTGDRASGKTLFLQLLNAIFGANCHYLERGQLVSEYNAQWATRLLLFVEETIQRAESEAFVNLLSCKTTLRRGRGERWTMAFHGKIIYTGGTLVDDLDNGRVWDVGLKVPASTDPNLLATMVEEIPAFIAALEQRELSTTRASRTWFGPSLLNEPKPEPLAATSIRRHMQELFGAVQQDEILMAETDLLLEVFSNRAIAPHYIREICTEQLGLVRSGYRSMYEYPRMDGVEVSTIRVTTPSRPFVFLRKDFLPQ